MYQLQNQYECSSILEMLIKNVTANLYNLIKLSNPLYFMMLNRYEYWKYSGQQHSLNMFYLENFAMKFIIS